MATRTLALSFQRWVRIESWDTEMLCFLRPGEQPSVVGSGQHGGRDVCLGRWVRRQGGPTDKAMLFLHPSYL